MTTEKSTILSCPAHLELKSKKVINTVLSAEICNQVKKFCILVALTLNLRAFLVKITKLNQTDVV